MISLCLPLYHYHLPDHQHIRNIEMSSPNDEFAIVTTNTSPGRAIDRSLLRYFLKCAFLSPSRVLNIYSTIKSKTPILTDPSSYYSPLTFSNYFNKSSPADMKLQDVRFPFLLLRGFHLGVKIFNRFFNKRREMYIPRWELVSYIAKGKEVRDTGKWRWLRDRYI